jgi:hypothetical protein
MNFIDPPPVVTLEADGYAVTMLLRMDPHRLLEKAVSEDLQLLSQCQVRIDKEVLQLPLHLSSLTIPTLYIGVRAVLLVLLLSSNYFSTGSFVCGDRSAEPVPQ